MGLSQSARSKAVEAIPESADNPLDEQPLGLRSFGARRRACEEQYGACVGSERLDESRLISLGEAFARVAAASRAVAVDPKREAAFHFWMKLPGIEPCFSMDNPIGLGREGALRVRSAFFGAYDSANPGEDLLAEFESKPEPSGGRYSFSDFHDLWSLRVFEGLKA